MSSQPNDNPHLSVPEASLLYLKSVVDKYIGIIDPDKEAFHMIREIKTDDYWKQAAPQLAIPI